MSMKRFVRSFACAGLAVLGSVCAESTFAQSYPAKPIRIVVPFLAGGSVDTMGRTFAQKFTEAWGQQVIVDNRPGAGGNIGADAVAKAAPDGYTLLLTTTGHAVAPSLFRKLPFDAIKDFAPVSQVIATYLVLTVNNDLPVHSLKELVALAKAQPGKLNYGHTGLGVSPHMTSDMLRFAAGIDIVAIPYKGDAGVVPALLSGEIQFAFSAPVTVFEHVRAGRMRAIAVTGNTRGSGFPDVPTTAEAGFPDVSYVGWVGFFAPGGTPRDILNKIAAETARDLRMPDVAARLPGWGGEAAGTTPDEFAAKYRADVARYAKIIKDANVPLVD
jgi:tripartite-type tricarboxylate transporter receptor subunit TctC